MAGLFSAENTVILRHIKFSWGLTPKHLIQIEYKTILEDEIVHNLQEKFPFDN